MTDDPRPAASWLGRWASDWRRRWRRARDEPQRRELSVYRAAAEAMTDMVSCIGLDQRYRMVNDAWCRAMNVERGRIVGRRLTDVLPGQPLGDLHESLERCVAERRVVHRRGPLVLPGGRERFFETSYYPYEDDHGGVPCAVVVTRDVTQQEAARDALAGTTEYLELTLNATDDGIFASDAVDADQPVRFVNRRFLEIWGIPAEEAPKLTPRRIVEIATPHFVDAPAEIRRIEQIVERNETCEERLTLRDGRVLLRRCVAAGRIHTTLRVWSFRDVTAEARALRALRGAEAQQRALLAAYPGLIAELDENLHHVYVNDRLCQALGRARDQVVGRSVEQVLGEARGTEMRRLYGAIQRGETLTFEREQAGQWMQFSASRGSDPHLDRTVFYAFGSDITALKRTEAALRASEAELRALLAAFPGFICSVDQDMRYAYANPRMLDLLGRPAEQVLGRPIEEALPPFRVAQAREAIARAVAGEPNEYDAHYPATGARAAIDLRVRHVAGPLQPDGSHTVYVFGLDVTDRKRAEQALVDARDAAESANRAKSMFLSQMSHELRTPLNAILGFAQLLQRCGEGRWTDVERRHLDEIARGGRHLLSLINDVLDLASIEAGRMEIDCADLDLLPLADEVLSLMRPLAGQHGVHLHPLRRPDFERHVHADARRLVQVLLNLLGNAIKYNRRDGEVRLECSWAGGMVRLAVRDTGPGLDAEALARLFKPFERLSGASSAVEGTGIGLALSRHLATAMSGRIGVQSEPGKGSLFWIDLPPAREPAPPPAAPEQPAAPAPRATQPEAAAVGTVLYVEDNQVNAMVLEALFGRFDDLRLVVENEPLAGLRTAKQLRPDLILLDIHLPGFDGFEVLRRLREDPDTRDIPVVALSANAMVETVAAGRQAGFADYLTKPVDLDRLTAVVRGLVRTRRPGGAAS